MKLLGVLLFLVLLGCSREMPLFVTEDVILQTEDARDVAVRVFSPALQVKTAALVIAPGHGYHKDLPIIAELAEKMAMSGYMVVTFNWNFFTQKTERSKDLSHEEADLRRVIDYVKSHQNVDENQIHVMGKSLGSVIAYRIFHTDKSIKSLTLSTPIFPNQEAALRLHPGLHEETRPIHVVVGKNDPQNCPLPVLYEVLSAKTISPASVTVVGGDHGLNIGPYDDPSFEIINRLNIQTANSAVKNFLFVVDHK